MLRVECRPTRPTCKPTSVFGAAVRRRLAVDRRRRHRRRRREVAVGRAAEVHHGQRARQLVVHEGGGEQVELALNERGKCVRDQNERAK